MKLQIQCPACRITLDYAVSLAYEIPERALREMLLLDHVENDCAARDNARSKEKTE